MRNTLLGYTDKSICFLVECRPFIWLSGLLLRRGQVCSWLLLSVDTKFSIRLRNLRSFSIAALSNYSENFTLSLVQRFWDSTPGYLFNLNSLRLLNDSTVNEVQRGVKRSFKVSWLFTASRYQEFSFAPKLVISVVKTVFLVLVISMNFSFLYINFSE